MTRSTFADGLFVVALMLYVLAGAAAAPFHGDEFMQMAMARDVFYLAHGNLDAIRFAPPVQPDTEQYLRLLNGPLNKDLIGLTWALDGRNEASLPGIFAWAMPLEWNVAHGNVPDGASLDLARFQSALFTALSVALIFWLTLRIAGRPMAYPAALLFALHPVILLNGRRAMMEGALLFFSLLLISVTIWVSKRYAGMRLPHPPPPSPNSERGSLMSNAEYWRTIADFVLVGVCAGLTVAAKHTGLVIVVAALLGLLWNVWRAWRWRSLILIAVAGVAAGIVFFALNPAYWNDPIGAFGATLGARTDLLARQVRGDPTTYTSPFQHVAATLIQPFMTPPQYYEAPTWNGVIDDAIRHYELSAVSGWRWPLLIGVLLTAATLIGAVLIGWQALSKHDSAARVLLLWFGAVLASSLAVPLDWQRYYLPLFPVYILMAAYVPFAIRLWVKHA